MKLIMIGFTVMKPSSINCNNITVVRYLKSFRNGLIILCKFFLLVGEILFHSPRLDRTRVPWMLPGFSRSSQMI